jgi:hypothetical protein
MSFKGKENVYTCDKCGGMTVTVDVDEGVTPFTLICRASGREGDCDGRAYSSMYPNGPRPPHIPEPSWEWYRPDAEEMKFLSGAMREHVERGGLEIRRREGSPVVPSLEPAGYFRDRHGSLRRVH